MKLNNYLYRLSLTVLLIQPSVELVSQVPEIIWQYSIGGTGWDYAGAIELTPDSGFIVGGYTGSSDGDILETLGLYDYWVLKLDSLGIIEWQKSYGGSNYDFCYDIKSTYDGGFIIVGGSYSNDGDVTDAHGNLDYWVVKTDGFGNIEWQKALGGTSADIASSVVQSADGGYLVVGNSNSNDGNVSGHHGAISETDIWVVKLNEVGEILWERSFGSTMDDGAQDVIQTVDGSYIVVGTAGNDDGDVSDFHGGVNDLWVIKINGSGELQWENTFGGSDHEGAFSVSQSSDFGFLICGETGSSDGDISGYHGGVYDVWILKLDSLGNIVWKNCYGGTSTDFGSTIFLTLNNSFVVGAYSGSSDGDVTETHGGGDYWIFEIDSLGAINWQKSLGGSNGDYPWSIVETIDNNYAIAGYSRSADGDLTINHGDFDYWIVKLGVCEDVYYADADGDGYGDILNDSIACSQPLGFVGDSTDCNDSDILIHLGIIDNCNDIDDDCDGLKDEDAIFLVWYQDNDTDGFGDVLVDSITCFELPGYVFDNTDCNDANSDINPGESESCNSFDDNCNDLIDEDLVFTTYYVDADEDYYGNAEFDSLWCSIIIGYVADSTDCDDTNPDINPGIPEVLNGVDDNCNLFIDEGLNIDENILSAIKIYPNPTEDILHIEYTGFEPSSIDIINSTGQILWSEEIVPSLIEIDVNFLSSGIYLLKIKTSAGEASLKFVKE